MKLGTRASHTRALKLLRDARLLRTEALVCSCPHTPATHKQLTPLFSKVGYIVVYTIEEMAPTNGQPVYQFTIVSVVSIPSVPRLEFVNEVSAAFKKATLAHPCLWTGP